MTKTHFKTSRGSSVGGILGTRARGKKERHLKGKRAEVYKCKGEWRFKKMEQREIRYPGGGGGLPAFFMTSLLK